MEVLTEPSFGIGTTTQVKGVRAGLFLTEESNRIGLRRCGRSPAESSSSVGESSENEEDDGVSFSSSLEDSLPIKRGLSNHYIGKSKSFGNLMEASNVKDMVKVESPMNKRRRLIIANKLRRRSSLSSFSIYSKISPHSMPLLALQESDDEGRKYNDGNSNVDDDDDDDDSSDGEGCRLQEKKRKMSNNSNNREFMVQTQSCICLSSFQDDDR